MAWNKVRIDMIDKAKNSDTETIGNRLARIRKDAGYSLRSLAEETGISHRMICYYESQGGRPPADILLKLADALNVTTDELLGRKLSNRNNKPKNQRLLRKFLQLEKLSPRDRESVLRIIDGLISKQKAAS